MGGIALAAAMRGLAATIQPLLETGRTAYAYPARGVQKGDAIVPYPDEPQPIAATFGRGSDEVDLEVGVLCGLDQDTTTLDEVAAWITGADEVVAAVAASNGLGGAVNLAYVTTWHVTPWTTLGQPPGTQQLAVVFTVHIVS